MLHVIARLRRRFGHLVRQAGQVPAGHVVSRRLHLRRQRRGELLPQRRPLGQQAIEGRQSIAAGTHPLSIGDRIGSYYAGFPGLIDEVRISNGVLEFRRARVERISDRVCFVRMESPASLRFAVTNLQPTPLAGAEVGISLDGMAEKTMKIAALAPASRSRSSIRWIRACGPTRTACGPVEHRRPRTVPEPGGISVRIVPRQPPHGFPC